MRTLESIARHYKPKQQLFYGVALDKHGNQLEEIEIECCEDCTTKALKEANKNRRAKYYSEETTEIDFYNESSPQSDDYKVCEYCGHYIEVSVLQTFSQEIDHWLSLTDAELTKWVGKKRNAWVINNLLNCQTAKTRYANKLTILKLRLEKAGFK